MGMMMMIRLLLGERVRDEVPEWKFFGFGMAFGIRGHC
jgi:hypothetical protein